MVDRSSCSRAVIQPSGVPGSEPDTSCMNATVAHAPESQEHLHLKALVARAVAQAGWSAATEVPGEGFIADVMGIRDGASGLRGAEVPAGAAGVRASAGDVCGRRRTGGVAGRQGPARYQAAEHLPLFTVTDWLADPRVIVTGRTIAVNRLVGQLLAGSCRWRDVVPSTGAAVETMRLLCPMCGDLREVGVSRWLRGTCACGLPVIRQMRSGDDEYRRTCCGYWGRRSPSAAGPPGALQEIRSPPAIGASALEDPVCHQCCAGTRVDRAAGGQELRRWYCATARMVAGPKKPLAPGTRAPAGRRVPEVIGCRATTVSGFRRSAAQPAGDAQARGFGEFRTCSAAGSPWNGRHGP